MITPELIFNIGNLAILPAWVLMIFAPTWKYTKLLAESHIAIVLVAFLYACIVLTHLGAIAEADFMTLKGIKNLFASAGKSDYFIAAAWFHYLAFDLAVGTFIYTEAQKRQISHGFVIPCLLFTFMLGPVGFLLFYLLKNWYKR